MDFWVFCMTLSRRGGNLRTSAGPKLPGNERFSSSPFQRMSKLSQRIIFDEVTAVSSQLNFSKIGKNPLSRLREIQGNHQNVFSKHSHIDTIEIVSTIFVHFFRTLIMLPRSSKFVGII